MGNHLYCYQDRQTRATQMQYATAPVNQLFKQNEVGAINEGMDPRFIAIRKACDSDVHPNTLPVIINLDVTGSMGRIPHQLLKTGLVNIVADIEKAGITDPAILFCAIGDHRCDRAPLQVGQFESGDAQLDHWLTTIWLEGCGGGNHGESYFLAWYFAAMHTYTDAWAKRQTKGVLFTIGDEPPTYEISADDLKKIMGDNAIGEAGYKASDLLAKARERYHVYHIHIQHDGYDDFSEWQKLMGGEHVLVTDDYNRVPEIIANTILALTHPNKAAEPASGGPQIIL